MRRLKFRDRKKHNRYVSPWGLPRWHCLLHSLTLLSSQRSMVPRVTPFTFPAPKWLLSGAFGPDPITGEGECCAGHGEGEDEPQPEEKQVPGLLSGVIVSRLLM